MNIIFFCKRYYTNKDLIEDEFGRLFHLPIGLSKLGNNVTVVAIDYRNNFAIERAIDGVIFKTVLCSAFSSLTFILNIYKELSELQPDLIVASGDSHIGYIAHRYAKKVNIPFVFDVYDYYPAFIGNRIPGMKAMFTIAVEKADLVLVVSKSLKNKLIDLNENIVLIENGVDSRVFRVYPQVAVRERYDIDQNKVVIGYFGSITPSRGPLLIDACKLLRQSNVNVTLLLAGKVSQVDIDYPWIVYKGEVDQEQVPCLIAACDVVSLPYAWDEFNSNCGACKLAEYIYCEKPIVATDVSDHEIIFLMSPLSICRADSEAIAIAIASQLQRKEVIDKPKRYQWFNVSRELNMNLISLKNKDIAGGGGYR